MSFRVHSSYSLDYYSSGPTCTTSGQQRKTVIVLQTASAETKRFGFSLLQGRTNSTDNIFLIKKALISQGARSCGFGPRRILRTSMREQLPAWPTFEREGQMNLVARSFPRAPFARVSHAPEIAIPFPFKRLSRRLPEQ